MDPIFPEPELFLTPEGAFPQGLACRRLTQDAVQKVDIVVPVHGQEEMTRQFLESLKAFTDHPYRLIVVDNGSKDLDASLVEGFEDSLLIRSRENLGFAGGCNKGISEGRHPLVVVCNNDLIMTRGWLSRMVHALTSDPAIAVVAPCTNFGVETQEVDIGNFWDVESMHQRAQAFVAHYSRLVEDVSLVSGMCLLMKREILDRIGSFDERFGLGNFEDNDLCVRIKNQGLRIVVARDVFIYHLGNRTFQAMELDYKNLLETNHALFAEKWRHDHHIQGNRFEKEGDLERALRAHMTSLKEGCLNPEPLLHAGLILLSLGKFSAAARSFRQYIERCPNSTRARLGLGWAIYLGGDKRQGVSLMHAVLRHRYVREEVRKSIKEFTERMEAENPFSWNQYVKV
ncbi:MAG: glycosyltransferase [Planctomycetota bacterium]